MAGLHPDPLGELELSPDLSCSYESDGKGQETVERKPKGEKKETGICLRQLRGGDAPMSW